MERLSYHSEDENYDSIVNKINEIVSWINHFERSVETCDGNLFIRKDLFLNCGVGTNLGIVVRTILNDQKFEHMDPYLKSALIKKLSRFITE